MFDSDERTPSRDLEPPSPVLNSLDCPLQGPIHDVNHYPKQYEPIYDLTLHDLPVSVKFDFKSFEKKIPEWLMSTSSEEHFRSILPTWQPQSFSPQVLLVSLAFLC